MSGSGAVIELVIDDLAGGGDGVGRDTGGRVTFVPHSAPGDRVRVRIREVHRDFARAELVDIIESGPGRVTPPCPYFRERSCGGCQWQHIDAAAQRAAKVELVKRALRRVDPEGARIEPLVAPVPDYHWRRRARLHWFRSSSAETALVGFLAPKSSFVTDVRECAQLSPALAAALAAIREALPASLHGRGQLHLIEGDEGVHVVIDGHGNPAAARRLAASPAIAGVVLGDRALGRAAVTVDGRALAATDFVQASGPGNRALRALLSELAAPWRDGAGVLELFAGHGNLTTALAGAQVTAVDTHSSAPELPGVIWRIGAADQVTAALVQAGERFDGVVLDPPRKGAREVVLLLPQLAPSRIVYVSCDPATLGRDAEILTGAGYSITRVVPLDLMPQTAHIEVVAVFETTAQSPK